MTKKTKTAFCYDPMSGLYVGEVEADESPLEPGKYLIPAHATEAPLPDDIAIGSAAFWRGPGLGWCIESLPEILDDDKDGKPDAPPGFKESTKAPGFFQRVANLLKG